MTLAGLRERAAALKRETLALCPRLLPADVLEECRTRARESLERPRSYAAAAVIIAIWIAALVAVGWWVARVLA